MHRLAYSAVVSVFLLIPFFSAFAATHEQSRLWNIESIDTVKHSRDLAREKAADPAFAEVIRQQVESIAGTGATHIALGTPYEAEFVPFLRQWVAAARQQNLKIWFRGNLAGWEGWFDYPRIDRQAHLRGIESFILSYPDLFEHGDVFSTCPECENGGPGDPRFTGDVVGHRNFLVEEHETARRAFHAIERDVKANMFSMNGDVAALVMNREMTERLGGVVVLDHYVLSPEQLVRDVVRFHEETSGRIVIGEIGIPIPAIHGEMTEEAKALWLQESLGELARLPYVDGVNYWTSFSASTQLWNDRGEALPVQRVLKSYFAPSSTRVCVQDELSRPILDASIVVRLQDMRTDNFGCVVVPHVPSVSSRAKVSALGYVSQSDLIAHNEDEVTIELMKHDPNILFRIGRFLQGILER